MFIEMAAYVGDVLSFYQDNQIQENFLQYAKEKDNLLTLAYMFGYKPKVTTAATTRVEIFQLLPSMDANGNAYTGSIAVSNSSGVVVLNQAFEVTRVENNLKPPSPPKKEARQAPQDDKPKVKDDPRDNNNNNNEKADDNGEDNETKSKATIEVVEMFKTNPYDMSKVLFRKTTEQGNVTSLNIDATSDATINYLNNGIFQTFSLNNGSGVIFNIEQ